VIDFLNRLSDDGAGSSGLVLPGGGQDTDGLVVTGKTVDSGLNENEAELGVLVLAVALKVLADSNSLLDEHVQILGKLGGEAVGLQDSEDSVTGDNLDLGNAVGVTEDDTDLRRGSTLSGELADLVDDLVGGSLQPRGGGAGVGESGGRNALALAVKSAHLVCLAAAVVVMLRMVSSRSRLGRAS